MIKYFIAALFTLAVYFAAAQDKIAALKITELESYMAQNKDEVMVVNFWATFCKPCIAEIPVFIKVTDSLASQNVKLILVSLDMPSAYPNELTDFVKGKGYKTKIIWLNETDADYFCNRIDKSWSGAIPATLIINNKTGYRKFFEEEITSEKLSIEITLALKSF